MEEVVGWWEWALRWLLPLGLLGLSLVYLMVMRVLEFMWWRPRRLEKHFAKQGIRGPAYCFCIGNIKEMVGFMREASSKPMVPCNSHSILPRALSFYHHWEKIYGSTFVLWFGPNPWLTVADPNLIREIFVSRADAFERYATPEYMLKIEGEGLINLRDEKWAHHRKVISPIFHMENLKCIISWIGKMVVEKVEKWPVASSGEVEIEVSAFFQDVTEDVITQIAFGRSYDDGNAVFKLQAEQMVLVSQALRNIFIPGYKYLPTRANTRSWKLDKEIRRRLVSLIRRRMERGGGDGEEEEDMLGQLISASTRGSPPAITVDDIVEECKTFFFAGKQTTSNMLTWTTVMLAMHPDWQDLARQEVLRVCGARDIPTRHQLAKLKTLTMILNESLRLYPPGVATVRRAKDDVELGGHVIPRGTELLIPILAVHHDTRLWGPDAEQFNPGRFAGETHRAHPSAFIPFGLGARVCIGKNLAQIEAKMSIALILQRFSLRLSPSYIHAPTILMLMYPQYGAPVIFRTLAPPSDGSKIC